MKKSIVSFWIVLLISLISEAQVLKVEITHDINGHYNLLREGKPFYIKGAGGSVFMDKVAEAGGNSIRLWGADNAQEFLDEAHKHGLTVMLGLWMTPERHGFDYSNTWACADQLEQFKVVVKRFRNHPALLLWGVGNEVDLEYTDFSVWNAVQNIAAMIHEEDKNHPTVVVTAGIDAPEVSLIKEFCPDIDILGINTYGDLPGLAEKIRLFGWEKPYIVTEWGPNGHWEVEKTSWGAPIEQTSTEKVKTYKQRYKQNILTDTAQCLGSYAFLWGQKQETTPTWYGLFVDDKQTEVVYSLYELWGGKSITDIPPAIDSFALNNQKAGQSLQVRKGAKVDIRLKLRHSNLKNLSYRWELLPESEFTKSGGDAELKPGPLPLNVKGNSTDGFSFKAPFVKGAYRIFLYITDSQGYITYANFPFLVK